MEANQAQEFGAAIRRRRLELGLTTRELGERAGINYGFLSRIENGAIHAPGPDKLARLAEALQLGLADLYARADYVVPDELPAFEPYLRTKYRHQLPADAIAQLEELFDDLTAQHRGPANGEDEAPEPDTTSKPASTEGGNRARSTPAKRRRS